MSDLSPEELRRLYRSVLLPRMIEEKMLVLLRQGRLSKWFAGIGQEAIATGVVTTLAGSGAAGFSNNSTGTSASFNAPEGIAVIGSNLYVADTGNHAVRKVVNSLAAAVTTIAGAAPPTAASGHEDGSGTSTRFTSPRGIAAVGSVLYLADTGNHVIRRITTAATVTTFAGDPLAATTRDGEASQALLNAPAGIAGTSGTIYFTDVNENVVRKILF